MRRLRLRPRLDGRVNCSRFFTTAADDRSALGAERVIVAVQAAVRQPLRFRVCVRAFFAGRDMATWQSS
jgi:hypothetical protein